MATLAIVRIKGRQIGMHPGIGMAISAIVSNIGLHLLSADLEMEQPKSPCIIPGLGTGRWCNLPRHDPDSIGTSLFVRDGIQIIFERIGGTITLLKARVSSQGI